MAFLEDFGKPENDLGDWKTIGVDKVTGRECRLRVRPIPFDLARKFETALGRDEKVVAPDTGRARIQRLYKEGEVAELVISKAEWALTEAEGLTVAVRDAEAAKFYTGLFGSEVEVGATIDLDQRLTKESKRRMFARDFKFAVLVTEIAEEVAKERGTVEERVSGN